MLSFELHGFYLLIIASLVAIGTSTVVVVCLLRHFVFKAEEETWPATSVAFRVLLSAGTLVILNLASGVAWFFIMVSTADDLRIWVDLMVFYTWMPLSIALFLLVYLCLGRMLPVLLASSAGRVAVSIWAFVSGAFSLVIVLLCIVFLSFALVG